ncbi:MAG: adenylate/guanylate cyclase domain-containing protein, partial [Pseudomonadota bacterium]
FFSDISGFTETADRLESEDMTELLNEYLTEMSNIALAHGATIDKYIGDAIMIFFGDPDSQGLQEDAVRCVRMAIDMRNRLRELAAIWESRGLCETLSTRTGIHTGYCTVGNFGSEDRMDYTIIGGAVNLASRLEHSATPGQILISNETYNLVREEVQCREAETIRVKGIAYPVKTFVALHTHEQAGTQAGRVFEQHEKFIVDVDLDRMGDEERSLARETLRSVLKRLDQDEEIAPEQQPPLDTRKTGSD